MRARFTTTVRGPRFRVWDAVTALRVAGLSVTLHPPGTFHEVQDDERLEVGVPLDTSLAQQHFEATIRVALAGTGFIREGGILPGS
jgi:hypothetical protein